MGVWVGFLVCGLVSTHAAGSPRQSPITIHGTFRSGGVGSSETTIELVATLDRFAAGELFRDARSYPEASSRDAVEKPGAFRLVAPGPGMWEVIASRPGAVPMAAKLHPLLEETVLRPLDLPEDDGIEVRVVDSRGRPIRDARVLAYSTPEWRLEDYLRPSSWQPARRAGRTGPEGTLTLPRARGERLTLEVIAEGFPPVVRQADGASTTLRLAGGAVRTFEIRAPGGEPAAGVQARLSGMVTPFATADEQGRISLRVAADGLTDVDLADRRGNHVSGRFGPPRIETPDQTEKVSLTPPVVVSGRVVGLPDRMPLSGALVWSRNDPGGVNEAGPDGTFVIRDPSDGDLLLSAAETGHFTAEITLASTASAREVEHSFALEARTALSGVVVDASGRPVAGVEVSSAIDPRDGRMRSRYGKTGGFGRTEASGRFLLGNLVPGARYELQFTIAGYPPITLTTLIPPVGEAASPLRVVLDEGIRASGTVVSPEGEPVAGVRVELQRAESRTPAERLALASRPGRSDPPAGLTDGDGRFSILDLAAGRYDLTARAHGYATARIRGVEVAAARAGAEIGTISLATESIVEGVARGQDGDPLEGVLVVRLSDEPLDRFVREAIRGHGPEEGVLTGGDGVFRVGGLLPGEGLELELSKPGFATRSVRTQAPTESPLVVVLQPISTVAGRVSTPDGDPVTGASVVLRRPSFHAIGGGQVINSFAPSPHRTFTGEDGSFRLEEIDPGRAMIEVTAADLLPTERSIDVPAGADVENLEIVARPAALVLGEVVSPSGEPVAGAEIREAGIELVPGAISYTAPLAVTDGDGRFRAGGLRSGALRLEADHPSYQRVIREIDAQPGENRLDFTLEGGSSIDGYVVDFERAPVASARVQVRTDRSGASFPWTRTGVDGRFELTGLAPGRYRLSAEKEGAGRSVGSVDIDVRDDPVSGVELELFPTATITGTIHGLDVDELARVRLQAGGLIGLGTVAFDGSYRIPELSPGPWSVVASLPGTGRFAEGAVVVEPGETEAHLDLDFGGGFVLSGSVIRSERPVSGAGVVALNGTGAPISTQTDQAGRFLFEGLSEGRYILEVSDFFTGSVRRLEVDLAGDREVKVRLEEDEGSFR